MEPQDLINHLKVAGFNAGDYDEVILHRSLVHEAINTISHLSAAVAIRGEAEEAERAMNLTKTEAEIWRLLLEKVQRCQMGDIVTVRGAGYMYLAKGATNEAGA